MSWTGRSVKKVEEMDFYIMDILTDPDYKKHFMYRFNISVEKQLNSSRQAKLPWFICYGSNPDLLLEDMIDETKRILGQQTSSCVLCRSSRLYESIILPAVSDYICEKTGKPKPFEYISGHVKTQQYNFDCYYANPNRKNRQEEV